MNSIKTLAAASAIAVAASSDVANAWDASVTFYEYAQFSGASFTVRISTSQRCFNIGCFNDRASSIHWDGIPVNNGIGNPMVITFFTDKDCGGDEKDWHSADAHPSNLQRDGIDDRVSSFMIMENSRWATSGTNTVCPFSAVEESALLSNTTVIDATETAIQQTNATASRLTN